MGGHWAGEEAEPVPEPESAKGVQLGMYPCWRIGWETRGAGCLEGLLDMLSELIDRSSLKPNCCIWLLLGKAKLT